MAADRGIANIRRWLPWVAINHLNGIFELEDLNGELYQKMIKMSNQL